MTTCEYGSTVQCTVQRNKTLRKLKNTFFAWASTLHEPVQGLKSLKLTCTIPHGVPIMTFGLPTTLYATKLCVLWIELYSTHTYPPSCEMLVAC